jgi:hypothetical protein
MVCLIFHCVPCVCYPRPLRVFASCLVQPDVYLDHANRQTVGNQLAKVVDTDKLVHYKQAVIIFPLDKHAEPWKGHGSGQCTCANRGYCFYDTFNRIELKKHGEEDADE